MDCPPPHPRLITPVWLQNLVAPKQGWNVGRSRAALGARREAELALNRLGEADCLTSPTLRTACSHLLRVGSGKSMAIPVHARRGEGHVLHVGGLMLYGKTATFTVSATTPLPAGATAPGASVTAVMFRANQMEVPLVSGVAYVITIHNAGPTDADVACRFKVQAPSTGAGAAAVAEAGAAVGVGAGAAASPVAAVPTSLASTSSGDARAAVVLPDDSETRHAAPAVPAPASE